MVNKGLIQALVAELLRKKGADTDKGLTTPLPPLTAATTPEIAQMIEGKIKELTIAKTLRCKTH